MKPICKRESVEFVKKYCGEAMYIYFMLASPPPILSLTSPSHLLLSL